MFLWFVLCAKRTIFLKRSEYDVIFPSFFQVCNSELASAQKNLEALRERNLKLEQVYNANRLHYRQQVMLFKVAFSYAYTSSLCLTTLAILISAMFYFN